MFAAVTISLGLAASLAAVSAGGERVPIGQQANVGWCTGQSGRVDLRQIMFLENDELDFDGRHGKLHIALEGQDVLISTLPPAEKVTNARNIGSAVSKGGDEPDVELKLGLLDGKLVVYWRETYLHRIYRQGLFSINDQDLAPLCEGRGGSEVLR